MYSPFHSSSVLKNPPLVYGQDTLPTGERKFDLCYKRGIESSQRAMLTSWCSLHESNNTSKQWIDATIMHLVFGGIILIMSLFALESPRWLAKVGQDEKAALNMSKLRKLPMNHPYARAELIDIHDELNCERKSTLGSGFLGPLKELFFIRSNLYRILLGLLC